MDAKTKKKALKLIDKIELAEARQGRAAHRMRHNPVGSVAHEKALQQQARNFDIAAAAYAELREIISDA